MSKSNVNEILAVLYFILATHLTGYWSAFVLGMGIYNLIKSSVAERTKGQR